MTLDAATSQIVFYSTPETMFYFMDMTFYVTLRATNNNDGRVKDDTMKIHVQNLITNSCQVSEFEIVTEMSDQTVQVHMGPVSFDLHEPTDTGKEYLHSVRLFDVFDCGGYSYTMRNLYTLVTQENPFFYTMETTDE